MGKLRALNSDQKTYENFYREQAGHGLPVFVGGKNYRGRGFGSLLGSIGRTVLPILKRGGKNLLKESAKSGLSLVGDVLAGKNLKSSLKKRAGQAAKRLLDDTVNNMAARVAFAPPGEPEKKRIKTAASRVKSKQTRARKKQRRDIFS